MGKAKAKLTPAEKAQRRSHTIKHLKQYSALYAMMILPLLYFIIFKTWLSTSHCPSSSQSC